MKHFSLFAPLGVGLTLLLLLAVPISTLAQIEHGGEPLMWGQSFEPALTWQTFDALDLETAGTGVVGGRGGGWCGRCWKDLPTPLTNGAQPEGRRESVT